MPLDLMVSTFHAKFILNVFFSQGIIPIKLNSTRMVISTQKKKIIILYNNFYKLISKKLAN